MKALVLGLLLVGCGARRSAARLEGHYALGDPGEGWERVRPGGADQAWHNKALGATIYADSNCGDHYDDAPLVRLHEGLLGAVAGEPLREELRSLAGREALLRVSEGKVDGVPVRLGALILKKDECVYDVVLIAPPSSFDTGFSAFEAVIAAFSTQAGS